MGSLGNVRNATGKYTRSTRMTVERPEPPTASSATRTLIFIPAWNEQGSVAAVIDDVRQHLPEADILVIDDGSTDATARTARNAGAAVASLAFNEGIGVAVQTGYRYAHRLDYELCARLDGDGQHRAAELRPLLDAVGNGVDLVVGSRFVTDSGYRPPLGRRLGIGLFRTLLSIAARQRFTDVTSGTYAAGPQAIALFASVYTPEFPELEHLLLASQHDLSIRELPVRMDERTTGRSSLRALRTLLFCGKALLTLTVGPLRSQHTHFLSR